MIRRHKIIVGVLVAMLCGGYWWLQPKKIAFQPEATSVDVAKVHAIKLPQKVQAAGTLVAAQDVKLAPEMGGQVEKILFQDGMFVKKGTPLIQLNDAVYTSKLESAKADLHLSETTYARIETLATKGIISRQDQEKAFADLTQKRAAMKENQALVNNMLLVAPFDGIVGKRLVSPGNHVSAGQELVALTDTTHLHLEYAVPESTLPHLKLGQAVSMTTSTLPGKVFTGKLAFIAPTINTQDRTIAVYAEIPNPTGELVAGLFASVQQQFGEAASGLMVPSTSLMATIDGQQVLTVVDGKVHTVPVVVGQHTESEVQVLQGLALGDTVIVAGQQKVHEGAAVTARS